MFALALDSCVKRSKRMKSEVSFTDEESMVDGKKNANLTN